MRLVFFGSGDFALKSLEALLAAGFAPVLVVTPPPRRRRRRGAEEPTADRRRMALTPEELAHYVGRYLLAPGQERSVMLENGRLYFDQGGGRLVEMIPESQTLFFVEGARGYFTFELDPDGAVTAMVIHTANGREIRAARQDPTP